MAINTQNLIPNEARTPEQRRENARKAGKASAEAARKRKAAKETAKMLLELKTPKEMAKKLTEMGIDKSDSNMQTVLLVSALNKGMKGDISAARFLFEMAGESPQQNIQVTTDSRVTIVDDIPEDEEKNGEPKK